MGPSWPSYYANHRPRSNESTLSLARGPWLTLLRNAQQKTVKNDSLKFSALPSYPKLGQNLAPQESVVN